jgi:hypothetical protein
MDREHGHGGEIYGIWIVGFEWAGFVICRWLGFGLR